MTLKTLITTLQELYLANPKVLSTGYGEQEAYDNSKEGVLYPRAYLHLLEGYSHSVKLKLTVTDAVLPDQSNRLDVQSAMFTLIKELGQMMLATSNISIELEPTYMPTNLYSRDSSEGFYIDLDITLNEVIDVCDITNDLTN